MITLRYDPDKQKFIIAYFQGDGVLFAELTTPEIKNQIEILREREIHNRACWRSRDRILPNDELTLYYWEKAEECLAERIRLQQLVD